MDPLELFNQILAEDPVPETKQELNKVADTDEELASQLEKLAEEDLSASLKAKAEEKLSPEKPNVPAPEKLEETPTPVAEEKPVKKASAEDIRRVMIERLASKDLAAKVTPLLVESKKEEQKEKQDE